MLTTMNTNAVDFWVGLDDRSVLTININISINMMSSSRTTEGTYTFSDGTSFTLTGGTIGTSDATWSTDFTAWKDGQPKDDVAKQEKQDCVKVRKIILQNLLCLDVDLPELPYSEYLSQTE